jgi:hypothetical protein
MASHARLWKILGICGPYTGSLNGAGLLPADISQIIT